MEARPQRLPAMDPLDESAEEADQMYQKRGSRCCCFGIPALSSPNHTRATCSSSSSPPSPHSNFWCRMRPSTSDSDTWWHRAFKKVRDWSELVAGPRWKTFIRRFNRGGHRGVGWRRRFQYDPLSYAMNFDEGGARDDEDDDSSEYGLRSFSTRYAAQPASAKSSMDLGGRDAPPLFTAPPGP